MRTLLHVVALIWGASILSYGLTKGMPAPPLDAYAWGQLLAFGFGAMMVMVGALYILGLLTNDDGPRSGGTTLVMVLVAVAATAGAVKWKGNSTKAECAAMVEHLRSLATVQDTTGIALARFENARLEILERCKHMTSASRRCILRAGSMDDLAGCP